VHLQAYKVTHSQSQYYVTTVNHVNTQISTAVDINGAIHSPMIHTALPERNMRAKGVVICQG